MLLDIIILFFLCKSLGNMLRAKGRTPIGYQITLVIAWFGAEVVAGFFWGLAALAQGQEFEPGIGIYIAAVVAAAAAAGSVFLVVHLLPSVDQVSGPQSEKHVPFGHNVSNPYSNSDNPFEPPRQ